MSGKLYIVPTPIGNLEDITFRAIRILKEVQLVLAEDTRTSRNLLKYFDINTPLQAYHMHNEHKVVQSIVEKINSGTDIALVSDAGTPGISDPGFLLIRACIENDVPIECLPGATAFVPALVVSGLPTDSFVFEGFLPHQKGRQKKLSRILDYESTVIVYESPYRVVKLLEQLIDAGAGQRKIVSAREISKKFESIIRGTVVELHQHFKTTEPKGEFVFILEGKSSAQKNQQDEDPT
ncbi:MAG TPA: 16S rRNA (cytidine(1402)-2'-O)-methyltransferase [Chitinophagales bacterium]|nr:16S rRNA (cytidine(1402)-2'-O)-methyltransferase [Chitinophagales bacterium]